MNSARFQEDLANTDLDAVAILNRYLLNGQCYAFRDNVQELANFRVTIARRLTERTGVPVHPTELVVCGSAHLGFSPVIDKGFRDFNSTSSDMDLGIVSERLFDKIWKELHEANTYYMDRNKVFYELFRGFFFPPNVRRESVTAHAVDQVLSGHDIRPHAATLGGRIYKDQWAMQTYHLGEIKEAMATFRGQQSATSSIPSPTSVQASVTTPPPTSGDPSGR